MANWTVILSLIAILLGANTSAWAQNGDLGKSAFEGLCAPCHGTDAKGNGPVRGQLKFAPPDLTILAKKNGGTLPVALLYDVIDGRKVIAAHGTREMPIWGAFSSELLYPYDRFLDRSYDPEVIVRTQILAIIDYLNRIQQK